MHVEEPLDRYDDVKFFTPASFTGNVRNSHARSFCRLYNRTFIIIMRMRDMLKLKAE